MKKTVLAFGFMTMALVASAQNAGNLSGIIQELIGTVEIKAPGAPDYSAAKTGDILSRDTIISTGFKSSAMIQVGSAVIAVRPLTRLTLTEIQSAAGTETINVNLQTGRVRVDVKPPARTKADFSVTSPSATASVRGTGFDFDTRNLSVNNGTVSFAGNEGKPVLVSAGSSSQVAANGRAVDPLTEKNGDLLPAPPAGRGTGRRIFDQTRLYQTRSDGIFTINIKYPRNL